MNKKIILGLVVVTVLTGCSLFEETKPKKEMKQEKQVQDYVEPYVDDNPIEVGLYVNNEGSRTLVTDYSYDIDSSKDLVSLEVYYSRDETMSGSQKILWNNYYQNYQDIDKYKIGYYVSFEVNGEEIKTMILKPSDGNSIFNYVQIYLYDDINQGDGFYIHITDEEMTEDSILTSIKLTAGASFNEVSSSIRVKAFTYDSEDDFDEDGLYRGSSSYEVVIDKK